MPPKISSLIDTAAKRAKLPFQRNPYWQGVSGGRGGVSLGYRPARRGPGSWAAKLVSDGVRREERIAQADDAGATPDALDYPKAVAEALAWARRTWAAIEGQREEPDEAQAPTVRAAVEAYIAEREKRSARGADARSRLTEHVLENEAFAGLPLAKLTAAKIIRWRDDLRPASVKKAEAAAAAKAAKAKADGAKSKGRGKAPKPAATSPKAGLKPSTVNRLLNDLRAALNAMAERRRRELPAHIVAEIKVGTRAIPSADEARRQVLDDAEVRAVVEAAFAVDPDGDFGRLVLLLAATGARFSQLAALTVADVQAARLRILIPASKKGRGAKAITRTAVQIGQDVLDTLRPALAGRRSDEPLLTRWHKKQTGPYEWVKEKHAPWKTASEADRMWSSALARAGLEPETVMYALRHTSIVRGLRNGLPVRLVAALHDTSTAMIEKHYAAFIVDATEDLARRAVVPMFSAPVAPLHPPQEVAE